MPFLAQKGVGQLAAEEPVAAVVAAAVAAAEEEPVAAAARMMPVRTHDMTHVAAAAWHGM